jgi:hypothetical protein
MSSTTESASTAPVTALAVALTAARLARNLLRRIGRALVLVGFHGIAALLIDVLLLLCFRG